MQLEEFRARLEEFDEAINREHYLHYSGLKPSLETIRFFDEYSKLFSLETIRELQRQLEAADDGFYAADCLRAWIFEEITCVPSLAIPGSRTGRQGCFSRRSGEPGSFTALISWAKRSVSDHSTRRF